MFGGQGSRAATLPAFLRLALQSTSYLLEPSLKDPCPMWPQLCYCKYLMRLGWQAVVWSWCVCSQSHTLLPGSSPSPLLPHHLSCPLQYYIINICAQGCEQARLFGEWLDGA